MNARPRAALYAVQGSTLLMTTAHHAKRAGLRVVTMIEEGVRQNAGLGGARLDALIDRLVHGEFEVILADVGSGRSVTIAAAPASEGSAPGPVDWAEVFSPEGPAASEVRCAIYAQCATQTGEPDPLAAQVDACKAYAADKGWESVAVYRDVAVSGMAAWRAGLNQMMADARRGTFDAVLVQDLARLGRNASATQAILETLNALGVAVSTVGGGANQTTLVRGFEPRKRMVLRGRIGRSKVRS